MGITWALTSARRLELEDVSTVWKTVTGGCDGEATGGVDVPPAATGLWAVAVIASFVDCASSLSGSFSAMRTHVCSWRLDDVSYLTTPALCKVGLIAGGALCHYR